MGMPVAPTRPTSQSACLQIHIDSAPRSCKHVARRKVCSGCRFCNQCRTVCPSPNIDGRAHGQREMWSDIEVRQNLDGHSAKSSPQQLFIFRIFSVLSPAPDCPYKVTTCSTRSPFPWATRALTKRPVSCNAFSCAEISGRLLQLHTWSCSNRNASWPRFPGRTQSFQRLSKYDAPAFLFHDISDEDSQVLSGKKLSCSWCRISNRAMIAMIPDVYCRWRRRAHQVVTKGSCFDLLQYW